MATKKKSSTKQKAGTDLTGLGNTPRTTGAAKPKTGGAAPDKPWYTRGQEGFVEKAKLDKVQAIARERSVPRFMLRAEEEAVIVFVDNSPFFIWEHNVNVGGRWGNYITCLKEYKPCGVCEQAQKSTYTAYLTVIDTREFTRKDGTTVKNRRILYPTKGPTIKKLEEIQKKRGDLTGCAFRVKRYTAQEPNCGSSFEFVKKVSLVGADTESHDYEKILRPLSEDELAAMGFSHTVVGSSKDVTPELGAPKLSTLKDLV